jgi:hypothetical protein
LDETNTGVKKKESADNAKVDPIFKTSSKNGSSFLYVVLAREDTMMVIRHDGVEERCKKWG